MDFLKELSLKDFVIIFLSITGLSIIKIIETYFIPVNIPLFISLLITVFVVLGIAVLFSGKRDVKKSYKFEEGSAQEAKFFQEWYKNDGVLKVFCTDLEWLIGEDYSGVREVLREKKNHLYLYLKDWNQDFVRELENHHGANIMKVRPDIRSEHRFSINYSNGFRSIIIRNKEFETNRIQIDEYHNNPALINLALDMLDDCTLTGHGYRNV